jgi:hypothetical protein
VPAFLSALAEKATSAQRFASEASLSSSLSPAEEGLGDRVNDALRLANSADALRIENAATSRWEENKRRISDFLWD